MLKLTKPITRISTENSTGKGNKLNAVSLIFAAAILLAMAAVSEGMHDKEVIFPEIAAMALGYLISPRQPWRVTSVRMFILITCCAWSGLLIVLYLPLPLWYQIVLAFIVSQIFYLFGGTTMAPIISAAVLPVILQTQSIVYPISASALTLGVVILHEILVRSGKRIPAVFTPVPFPGRNDLISAGKRIITVMLLAWIAINAKLLFMAAPPVLVAFTEFTNPKSPARRRPLAVSLLITACALYGAFFRFLLMDTLHLPLTLCVLCVIVCSFLTIKHSSLWIPPAAAMALLAMIVPDNQLPTFTLQVFCGIAILMGIAIAFFQDKKKASRKEQGVK
ncbi:MAG: hypothetical protein ACI4W2_10290 [Eubacterium sp.]